MAITKGNRYANYAPTLVENGFDVTPLNDKIPILQGWQKRPPEARDYLKYATNNIGVLCGGQRNLIAVDIDVYDKNASIEVSRIAEEILGFAPVRIGQAPKSLLVYRCSSPLKKLKSGVYDISGKDCAVEVLASGQQFVASGKHPGTQKKYMWPGDNLLDIEINDLTEVSENAVLEFIKSADVVLGNFGTLKAKSKSKSSKASSSSSIFSELCAPIDEIRAAMVVIPNPDIHYNDWVDKAHAIKGAVGVDGWEIFDQWSQKSEKYDADETRRVWNSIGKINKIGAGTIFHDAREHGFDIGEWRQKKRSPNQEVSHLEHGTDLEITNRVKEDFESLYGPIVFTDMAFWRYVRTHWEQIDDNKMRIAIHPYDGATYGEKGRVRLSKAKIDSILNELAAILFDRDFFVDAQVGINCLSGFILIDKSGPPKLQDHHRDHRARHVIPGKWTGDVSPEAAKNSLLAKLLYGCFAGDSDATEKNLLLAEVAGAAVLGCATQILSPKAIILKGVTAENGKSQILDMIRGLLPAEAVSAVPISKFGDDRHAVTLVGKFLNASDELTSAAAVASDTFKSIITGEPVSARDVYKSATTFRSVAQHIFATNDLPSFRGGMDRGVQRRLLVITFNRTIPETERIERIGHRVATEETDLLLDWAVQGASRLIKQRAFTEPSSSKGALRDWLVGSEAILAWLEHGVEVVTGTEILPKVRTRDAHSHFKTWAEGEGYSTNRLPSINKFTERVEAEGATRGILYRRASDGGYFHGLVLPQSPFAFDEGSRFQA